MASIKDLKKDIDLLMSLVLNDCFYVLEYNQKVNQDAVMKIATEVVEKHRDFRKRANHPDGKDNPRLVKKYYKDLNTELLATADEELEKLSSEVKKVS
jgi:hypothetical protein